MDDLYIHTKNKFIASSHKASVQKYFCFQKNGKSLLTSHRFPEKDELPCAVGPI